MLLRREDFTFYYATETYGSATEDDSSSLLESLGYVTSDDKVEVEDVSTDSLTTFVDNEESSIFPIEIPNHLWVVASPFTISSQLYYRNYYLAEMTKGGTFPSLTTDEYCIYNLAVDAIFGKSINTNKTERIETQHP